MVKDAELHHRNTLPKKLLDSAQQLSLCMTAGIILEIIILWV